ncbi:rRNA maturation RNase YbeY [Gynuella sp.]|uniref:rRNA maturation RNase YbeY n=1 Tax=Gynuella sp. TaxID=2969146 RepID=UPI003D099B0A
MKPPKPSIELDFQVACSSSDIPAEALFHSWIESALNGSDIEHPIVSIRIVATDESRHLNSTYRGKDNSTNVLSFPFESPPGVPEEEFAGFLGDLVICANVVNAEAQQQNKPLHHHWAHIVIHGVLHLLGYDHIDENDAEEMESLERQLLATLNIPDPYLVND